MAPLTAREWVVGCQACGARDTVVGDAHDVETALELWFMAHTTPVLLEVELTHDDSNEVMRWRRTR